jgi:hypothetical protein
MTINKEERSFMDLTGQRLQTTSRLRMFPILKEWNNEHFINIFRSYVISSKIKLKDDYWFTYVIETEDWWDNISNLHYDTPNLWWVICILNDIVNPMEEIEEGMVIKILKENYLYIVFNDLNRLSIL